MKETEMPLMNATGFWTVGDYGSTPFYTAGKKEDKYIPDGDKRILKELAHKVLEISKNPEQDKKRKLWFEHNSLKKTRPLIICDPENGWNEIITESHILCKNDLSKRWEMVLRKEIFWEEKLCDDKPIEANFDIGYTFEESGWGIDMKFRGGVNGGSYVWEPLIKNYRDFDKLKFPLIEIDFETTERIQHLAKEIFDGILKVRLIGKWWWSTGLTYELVLLRGMEQIMIDMLDSPNFVHELMAFLEQGTLERIKFLERNNLFSLNNDLYLSPGGFGYTDELPGKKINKNVRTLDLWGFSESQETVGISPTMFEKFIFTYQIIVQSLFGLNSYGCCEPLDKRWNIIKHLPRLRKVSVSPWADHKIMAENLQDKYCYCMKPNPAYLAVPEIDKDMIRKNLKKLFDITRDCRVEVLMQDNHTIGKNPYNVINWVKIAKEEAEKIGGI
jgi:hypothetical protein